MDFLNKNQIACGVFSTDEIESEFERGICSAGLWSGDQAVRRDAILYVSKHVPQEVDLGARFRSRGCCFNANVRKKSTR